MDVYGPAHLGVGDTIKVLDHGYVSLIDSMGNDLAIVQAAQASFAKESMTYTEREAGILSFLMREGHGVPMEHVVLKFRLRLPLKIAAQLKKHRMCLSGDTRIRRVYSDGRGYGDANNAIEKMWELWHMGLRRTLPTGSGKEFFVKLPNRQDMWVMSFNEDTGQTHTSKVVDIVKNGVRETYEARTESGNAIRATLDHKFLTPGGWKALGEIGEGGYIMREGRVSMHGARYVPEELRRGITQWVQARKGDMIPGPGTDCYLCGKYFDSEQLELDHVVPVVENIELALTLSNIKPACAPCHREKTNTEQAQATRGTRIGMKPDRIVSISEPRVEETYDLVLEDPWHNFVAGGLVVHNSSWSEQSSRYDEMSEDCYLPENFRVQIGKIGNYTFQDADGPLNFGARALVKDSYYNSIETYRALLSGGIAKEQASLVLPVGLYTEVVWTINVRSLFNVLHLRADSHAQWEVQQYALAMESLAATVIPDTIRMFTEAGRPKP